MAYVDKPQDVVSRLKAIEAELERIRRSVGIASTVIDGGTLRLLRDARIDAIDVQGDLVFRLGRLGFVYADGRGQQGAEFRYEDGSAALAIWNPAATTTADRQYTAIYNNGEIVMSTDANSGMGLGRPWLPIAFNPARVANWQSTTASTFELLWEAFTQQQHPWIEARIAVTGAVGTTGEVRLVAAGEVIGSVVAFNGVAANVEMRSARLNKPFGQRHQVTVEARRLTGAGAISVKVDGWWRQT